MLISHSLGCYLFLNAWQTSGRLSLMFEILIYLKKSRINWTDIMSSLSLSLSLSRWYSCIGKNLKYIKQIRIRKLWVDGYFLENVFHAKPNTKNTFMLYFSEHNQTDGNVFISCKIFSTENILQLEIILHVSKHTLKQHFLLSKISMITYSNHNAILVFFYHLIFKSQDRTKFILIELVKVYFTNKIFFPYQKTINILSNSVHGVILFIILN